MRIPLDSSYLFDFKDRPGMFLDSQRRALAARGTDFHVIAVSIRELRLIMPATGRASAGTVSLPGTSSPHLRIRT